MSAEKGSNQKAGKTQVRPEELTRLALGLRGILRMHRDLGITAYPNNEQLKSFLVAGRPKAETRSALRDQQPPRQPAGAKAAASPRSPAESLVMVERDIMECRLCPLVEDRMGIIAARGGANARLMIVGDWSAQNGTFADEVVFGREEDAMLRRMISAMGMQFEDAYVTNAVKCCPAPGRQVEEEHGRRCFSYLLREIEVVRPKIILAMGEMACRRLLGKAAPVIRLRGRWQPYRFGNDQQVRVMPTLHPRLLLQQPELKRAVWQDLQQVLKALTG